MLGKRGRAKHEMRRTTSLTDFAPPDALAGIAEEEEEQEQEEAAAVAVAYRWMLHGGAEAGQDWLEGYRARAAAAPVGHRRNSADYSAAETAAFLRACGLCRRRLGPGRDTFMYKGDTAFCSLECRQQHITNEEWKEKCALTSGKEAAQASGGSEKPGAGGTVAAAS